MLVLLCVTAIKMLGAEEEEMKPPKTKALTLLTQQRDAIAALKRTSRESPDFDKWWQLTRTIVANLYGQESPQLSHFEGISYGLLAFSSSTPDSAWHKAYLDGLDNAEAQLEALVAEVTTFWPDDNAPKAASPADNLTTIFERFHSIARQLRSRHSGRPTLNVADEYDVQDLLHALLRMYYDDIRAEEWTPSYAGGSSRMDFILSEHGIVVEVKKTRPSMTAKDVGDQLLIDIARYKAHPGTKRLFCFVYDPDGLLPNPVGIERDLSKTSEGIEVRCFIRPK
jgi:hypothetical protein